MCAVDMGLSIAVFCRQRQPQTGSANRKAVPGIYFFAPLCRFFLYFRVNSTNRGVKPTSS
jgi:hypothetical protein